MNLQQIRQLGISAFVGISLSFAANAAEAPRNVAIAAIPATSFVSGHERLDAVNDGYEPANENDHSHPRYGNWPSKGTQWVEYSWPQPISTNKIDVYWWRDGQGIRLPIACRLSCWDGKALVPVKNSAGLGLAAGKFNTTTFDEVQTSKLRLEFDGEGTFSTGILEWRVYDSGKSPEFPPRVEAGCDRCVVIGTKTYLTGTMAGGSGKTVWTKLSGPGEASFGDAAALETWATFTTPGTHVLQLTGGSKLTASDTLRVDVIAAPPRNHLQQVLTTRYQLDSRLWNSRAKALVTRWIPHCIAKLSDPKVAEGNIENFLQAGHKNAGRPHKPHVGAPWSNAYTLNTFESICVALALDPQGDGEMIKAQSAMRATMEEWLPILLAAQEKDGYLQTRFTLGNANEQKNPPPRWTHRADHEGYVSGYFIEAAIAHWLLSDRKDPRMLEAAIRLADCWDRNIGPAPKKPWFDGHQEIEQALMRLARVIEEKDGPGKGSRYVALAKFLLDQRGGGDSYDQSHLPVVNQYEALGHAVRAIYTYSAMADVAIETGDPDYHSAVESLWSNLVHKKYYVTGGIGSGETSEGFGRDYSLPQNAYCESCSGCGEVFFQHKMNLLHKDARYADLFEETLYNAVLGSIDLSGDNFTYTNALDSREARYPWHGCPCCIGNIPRTLLMLPEWMYARSADGLCVNLFIGSTVNVGKVAGTDVQIVQKTDYPWQGKVSLTVNPAQSKTFALRIRVPRYDVSKLYSATPSAGDIATFAVNGKTLTPKPENGYAVITREWKAGDHVEFELPLVVQRITCIEEVASCRDRVAIRRGPVIFNIEQTDHQNPDGVLDPSSPLATEWSPDLLGGVMTVKGKFKDGSPLTAIPNYARLNRGGRSLVWIKAK